MISLEGGRERERERGLKRVLTIESLVPIRLSPMTNDGAMATIG